MAQCHASVCMYVCVQQQSLRIYSRKALALLPFRNSAFLRHQSLPFRVIVTKLAISLCGTCKFCAACTAQSVFVQGSRQMGFCHRLQHGTSLFSARFWHQVCFQQALFQMYWQSSLRLSDLLDIVLHCSACPTPWCIQNSLGHLSAWHCCQNWIEWLIQNMTCSLPQRSSRFQSCRFEALQLTGWHAELGLSADMCNDLDTKQRWTH